MQPQPQYPQYPQQPPPTYPQQPQYPPPYQQPYQQAPYYPPQPPPPPPVAGTLDDFFDQPSTGSKAWVFKDRPIGTKYAGIVARTIGKADVRQQTDQQGRPTSFRDGRPKFVMIVPMLVAPSQEFSEGQASWWVKGQARDELVRAMAEVGAPAGPPEAGAGITVTLVGMRPIPGMNPAFQYRITYQRPAGANPVPPPSATPWGVPVGQPEEPVRPGMGAYEQPAWTAPVPQPPEPTQPVAPPPAAPGPPAAVPAMAPNTLTPEQQALLAQLTQN